jgi:tetratricopeptide (TPR) repeat protein
MGILRNIGLVGVCSLGLSGLLPAQESLEDTIKSLLTQKKFEAAEQLLVKEQDDARTAELRGNIYDAQNQFDKAIAQYEKAAKENQDKHLLGKLAACYYNAGRYENAIELAEELLPLAKNDKLGTNSLKHLLARAHAQLGEKLYADVHQRKTGKPEILDQIIDQYTKAISLPEFEHDFVVRLKRGETYHAKNDLPRAREDFLDCMRTIHELLPAFEKLDKLDLTSFLRGTISAHSKLEDARVQSIIEFKPHTDTTRLYRALAEQCLSDWMRVLPENQYRDPDCKGLNPRWRQAIRFSVLAGAAEFAKKNDIQDFIKATQPTYDNVNEFLFFNLPLYHFAAIDLTIYRFEKSDELLRALEKK